MVVKTVDTARDWFVWADLEVDSKSLVKEFLETSGKRLISPAWWKWLCDRVRPFFKLYLVCTVFVSTAALVRISPAVNSHLK